MRELNVCEIEEVNGGSQLTYDLGAAAARSLQWTKKWFVLFGTRM